MQIRLNDELEKRIKSASSRINTSKRGIVKLDIHQFLKEFERGDSQ